MIDRTSVNRFAPWFVWIASSFLIYWLLSSIIPRDSTDRPGGRSGMILHVDHLTGCHYLARVFGGLVPRLDADGNHICTGEQGDAP